MFGAPDVRAADGPGRARAARWRRLFRSCALLAAAIALLPGCAAPAPSPPTATGTEPTAASQDLPAGVSVEFRQTRADVALRQAAVSVRNGTDGPLVVADVSVADPRFAAPAERVVDRASRIAPGASVDVRVQLAEVACDVPDEATATVTLHYRWGEDDAEAVATAPIVDAVPFVAALHANECLQAEAERSARVAFGRFTPSPPGEAARLEMVVTPTAGTGALRIVGIRETNLLTTPDVADSVHPLDIDQTGPDRSAVTVDLPILPARCDAHAVQEDKRGTVFRVLVEVDGRAGSFDLAATPDMRGEILGWIADWCGF